MTTATMTIDSRKIGPSARPRRSLEELVDRLMATLTFVETPTPVQAYPVDATADDAGARRPRRSLEELVDGLMNALTLAEEPPITSRETPRAEAKPAPRRRNGVQVIHEARRLRQAGDLDGALQTLRCVDLTSANTQQARWAYTEWKQLVKRRNHDTHVLVYSQGTGRAAALVPRNNGAAEVVAVLGMRWQPGKLVSRRSLRGLRPLVRGGASC